MRYQPLADRLIIEPAEEANVSPGGILIPAVATSHKHLGFGTVIATGAGRVNAEGKTVPLTVKAGDTIAYPRRAAAPIPLVDEDGRETTQLLLREGDIVAIVHDLPRASALSGPDGRLVRMMPTSAALPDIAYQNREELDVAEKNGWLDAGPDGRSDHQDDGA